MRFVLIAALSMGIAAPAFSQAPQTQPLMNEEVGVPVFPYDITDRPYEVLGEVKAGVRKATVFSKSPSQDKIYKELWERAQKLGADAVVKAQYGDAHVSAFSWGKANATGTAVRFLPASGTTAAVTAAGSH
ncbi:hypothetical protein A0J57_10505 [Sphingobium sp. 22B]|uniref:heavy metal-binding domain-containing protein n=1 Tax=Sphingobium sp. 22B TaxID=936474 RepID=UPI00078422C1|nr:heavy metal-binding domain-containing protein [Sphingobium sp. 22B]KYC32351.1 hypothetical protein A0J57_10505 [Sphingobium sp. 22B]OAP31981.1 hypothetical protein A8O16_10300 [Sphingobium sp. 20006FA]